MEPRTLVNAHSYTTPDGEELFGIIAAESSASEGYMNLAATEEQVRKILRLMGKSDAEIENAIARARWARSLEP
jgi:hypothetical protein